MTAGVGHNSGDASAHPDVLNSSAQSQLKSILERIETLDDEKDAIAEHIKEVYAESKGNGFSLARSASSSRSARRIAARCSKKRPS